MDTIETIPPVVEEKEVIIPADTTAIPNASEDRTKELLEERLRREGAEKKIVELKRKLKDAGVEENPDVNEVVEEALNKKLDALRAIASQNEVKLQRENSELRETIKAKSSTSNSSQGTNQSKPVIIEPKVRSEADRQLMDRFGLKDEDIK